MTEKTNPGRFTDTEGAGGEMATGGGSYLVPKWVLVIQTSVGNTTITLVKFLLMRGKNVVLHAIISVVCSRIFSVDSFEHAGSKLNCISGPEAPRMEKPSLGLQMIVKDESNNIRRIFNSVKGHVDGFCICDTGSQDDTKEEIAHVSHELGIPGTILQHIWQNFAHNRNICLRRCNELFHYSYWILLDADQELISPGSSLKAFLAAHGQYDAFWMREIYASIPMYHLRIISTCTTDWKYTGIIHEYIHSSAENISYGVMPDLVHTIHHQQNHRDSKHDIAQMLTSLSEINPRDTRMMFHLAKAYQPINVSAALAWYQERINNESPHALPSEEVFWSKYSMACMMEEEIALDQTPELPTGEHGLTLHDDYEYLLQKTSWSFGDVYRAFVSAAEYLPYRYEPWLRIAELFMNYQKNYIQCLVFALTGLRAGPNAYYTLFPEPNSLEKLHFLVCLCGLKTGHISFAISSCTKTNGGFIDREEMSESFQMADKSLKHQTFYAGILLEAALKATMSDRPHTRICKIDGNKLVKVDGSISSVLEMAMNDLSHGTHLQKGWWPP